VLNTLQVDGDFYAIAKLSNTVESRLGNSTLAGTPQAMGSNSVVGINNYDVNFPKNVQVEVTAASNGWSKSSQ